MRRQGFSYIEVLLAATISAAIFTAVMPLLFNSITVNRNARLNLLAYEAASNEIETLRQSKISSLVTPSHAAFTVTGIPGGVGDTFVSRPNFGDQKIVSVDVSVTWQLQGKSKKVNLSTFLYGSTE